MIEQPLLLLHGALYTAEEFKPITAALGTRVTPVPIEFFGHGSDSLRTDPFSIHAFANQVIDFLEINQIDRCKLFGFSMGGYVGLYMARFMPERIERVMTLGTKFDWRPETAAREVNMLDPDVIMQKVPRFAETLVKRHGEAGWRGVLERTATMMSDLGATPELTMEDLTHIEIPVRIGLGDRDAMVSLEETIHAYRQLPNGELSLLPNSPHPLERVSTTLLCREILDFYC